MAATGLNSLRATSLRVCVNVYANIGIGSVQADDSSQVKLLASSCCCLTSINTGFLQVLTSHI